jgi:hypothetical protein
MDLGRASSKSLAGLSGVLKIRRNRLKTRAQAPPQRPIMSVMFNSSRGGFRIKTSEHPSAAGGATKPDLSLKRPRRSKPI